MSDDRKKLPAVAALGIAGLFAVWLLGTAPSAHADVILTPGNSPGGTDNTIINVCTGNALGPALTVQGCLNTSHTTLIDVTSNEDLIANGGQARLEAADGTFGEILLAFDDPNLGFTKLVFNLNATQLNVRR